MEVSAPRWNSSQGSYLFDLKDVPCCSSTPFLYQPHQVSEAPLPLPDVLSSFTSSLLEPLLEKTKKWFSTPLRKDSVLKRLRHERSRSQSQGPNPSEEGWYTAVWAPDSFEVRSKEFILYWSLTDFQASGPIIPETFLTAATPRAQSPVPDEEPQVRTIHIQNTVESQLPEGLIPVQDLPSSNLPPLPFYVGGEEPQKEKREEDRRKIREARLRVALAKLKAERMAEHYYQRYGEKPEEDSDSELSSDSGSDESFGGQGYP